MSPRRFLADRARPITAANMHGDRSPELEDINHLDKPSARAGSLENDRPNRGAPSPARLAEMKRQLTQKGKRS